MVEGHRLDVMGNLLFFFILFGVVSVKRMTNMEFRRVFGVKKMKETVNRMGSECFEHVNQMSGGRLTKNVYETDVDGSRNRSSSCTSCRTD